MLEKAAKRNCKTRQEAGVKAAQQEDRAKGADNPQRGPTQSPGSHPITRTHAHTRAHAPAALGYLEKKQNEFGE